MALVFLQLVTLSVLLLSTGAAGRCTDLPAAFNYRNSKLPSPFTFYNGTQVVTKSDWECRRQEIFELLQLTEYGTLPPAPPNVTGSLSGKTLVVNVTHQGKTISFTAKVDLPTEANGPVPALITLGVSTLPPLAGVATITFNNDEIAAQFNLGSRGQGKFYTLYGANHSAGAFTAWAWGVSRIIDVLEALPNSVIDPQKLALTGCSRNGKGVLAVGAFEPRIALTLPQEAGSGGTGCWRITDSMAHEGPSIPNSTLTANQVTQEQVWFSTLFNPWARRITELPTDHHLLAALIAPRGLLVIENSSVGFLAPKSSWGCMKAARSVFQALGVPEKMGISFVGGHNHCQFPTSQNPELVAFVGKFLLDQNTNTTVVKTDNGTQFGYRESQWVDWATPTLT